MSTTCCNPRGPSPTAIIIWIGITALLTVLWGGPLFALVNHLAHIIGLGWLITDAVVTAAGITGWVLLLRRRARAGISKEVARLAEIQQPPDLMQPWFTRIQRDGMALTLARSYAGFAEVASASVCLASEAGFRSFTLSDGSAATARGSRPAAGVADRVEQDLSIDEARAWKSHHARYEMAAGKAGGLVPDLLALLAVRSWDIHGARQMVWTTGWCPRLKGRPSPAFGAAEVNAVTLPGVVAGLR